MAGRRATGHVKSWSPMAYDFQWDQSYPTDLYVMSVYVGLDVCFCVYVHLFCPNRDQTNSLYKKKNKNRMDGHEILSLRDVCFYHWILRYSISVYIYLYNVCISPLLFVFTLWWCIIFCFSQCFIISHLSFAFTGILWRKSLSFQKNNLCFWMLRVEMCGVCLCVTCQGQLWGLTSSPPTTLLTTGGNVGRPQPYAKHTDT